MTQPGAIRSEPVAVLTTVLCVALALTMALAPWERLGQGWQVAPPLIGVAVIAAAIHNQRGRAGWRERLRWSSRPSAARISSSSV